MTISARNVFKDIRVETLAQLGSVPSGDPEAEGSLTGQTETELATLGDRAHMLALGVATWDATAEAVLDEGSAYGFTGTIRAASDVNVTAENVFEETEGRGDVGTWWTEYREGLVESEGEPEAKVVDPNADDTVKDPGPIGKVGQGKTASVTGLKAEAPDTGTGSGTGTGTDEEEDASPGETPDDADTPPASTPVDTRMFLAEAVGRGTELGTAFNIQSVNIDLDADVRIAASRIEQETYYRDPRPDDRLGPLDLDAQLKITAANRGDIIVAAGAPGTSTGGEKGGYGAAVSWAVVTASANTRVAADAVLDLPDAAQEAVQDLLIVNTARSHAQNDDGGTALVAGIAVTRYEAQTRTTNSAREVLSDKVARIAAVDDSSVVTLAGSGAQGARRGFSFGVALNLTKRDTVVDLAAADFNLDGDLDIEARTAGSVLAAGSAHAQDKEEPEPAPVDDPNTPENEAEPEAEANTGESGAIELSQSLLGAQGADVAKAAGNGDDGSGTGGTGGTGGGGSGGDTDKTLAFSVDFAGTFGKVETAVIIEATDIVTDFDDDLSILAETKIAYGQASSVTAVAVDGVAIAGSFGLALIEHSTDVAITESTISFFERDAADGQGSTNIIARDTSMFDLLVTGRAGHSQDGWGIAISASFNQMDISASTVLDRTTLSNGQPNFGPGNTGGGSDGGDGEGGFDDEGAFDEEGGFDEEGAFDEEGGFDEDGGEGSFCIDGVCSDNTFGRETNILSRAEANSVVTVLAARDEIEAEVSGGQQMGAVGGLLEQAGAAAQKPADGDTDGDAGAGDGAGGTPAPDAPDDKKGKGFKGLSISIAPSVLNASSAVRITESFILVDRDGKALGEDENSVGALTIGSDATTRATIDASAGTVGLSFALTETSSIVQIAGSRIAADGNGTLSIASNVREVQDVAARVGNSSRYKIAGILSLRDALNRIEVDTGAGPERSEISSGSTSILARTAHDVTLTSLVEDSTSLIFAGAGIVSLAEADTRILMGGGLSGPAVTLVAEDVFTSYEATAVAVTGKFTTEEVDAALDADEAGDASGDESSGTKKGKKVKTPGAGEDTGKDSGSLKGSFARLTDETQAQADDAAAEAADDAGGTPPTEDDKKKASTAPSFVVALNLDRHDSVVETRIGGAGTDAETGAAYDLRSAATGEGTVSATARTAVDDYKKLTATKSGTVNDTSLGFVGTFALGFADTDTRAVLGETYDDIAARGVTLAAETVMPEPDIAALTSAIETVAGNVTADGDAPQLLAEDLMPDPSTEVDRDVWSVTNRSEGEANVGFVVDFGLHLKDVETTARVEEDARLAGNGALTVQAETRGGVISLRDIPVVEATVDPEAEAAAGEDAGADAGDGTDAGDTVAGGDTGGDTGSEVPVDPEAPNDAQEAKDEMRAAKEREIGKIGFGGAFQYVQLKTDTSATVGALDLPVDVTKLTVTAGNEVLALANTKSFGGADAFAFNAGLSIVDYQGSAVATVDDRAQITVETTAITARDDADLMAFGGAGSQSGKVSFGLGAGLVFADRKAVAAVTGADVSALLETGAARAGRGGAMDLGSLALSSVTGGFSASGSSAGAGGLEQEAEDRKAAEAGDDTAGDPADPNAPAEEAPEEVIGLPTSVVGERAEENAEGLGEQTTSEEAPKEEVAGQAFGLALAADFSGVFGTNRAFAGLVTETEIETANTLISAQNTSSAFLASGAALGTGGKVGLAGSAAVSSVKTTVEALNTGGVRSSDRGFRLQALGKGDLVAAAAGRGGSGGSFSVVGSGALHLGRAEISARSSGSTVTAVEDMDVLAGLDGRSVAIAGSLAAEVAEESRKDKLGLPDDVPDDPLGGGDDPADPAEAGDLGDAAGDGAGEGAGGAPEDEGGSQNFGLGIAYASTVRREDVTAEVTSGTVTAQDLNVQAENERLTVGVAAATGAAPAIAISGSAVVNVMTQTTTAQIANVNAPLTVTDRVTVKAVNEAVDRGQVGFTGGGSSFGLGISAVALIDRRDTIATVTNAGQVRDTGTTRWDLAATNTGAAHITVTSALASGDADEDEDDSGGGNVAVNIPVSLALMRWNTRAGIDGAFMSGVGRLDLAAREAGVVSNRQQAITASGDHAGTVGVALTTHNSDVTARIADSDITAGGVHVTAQSASLLRAVALRDGDAENSLNVITSILKANGETKAEIDETTLRGTEITLSATDETVRDELTNGFAESAGVGISGGVGVDLYKRDLIARAVGSTLRSSSDLYLEALSRMKASNVVIGQNGGGGFAVQANIAWTTDARDVVAEIVDTHVAEVARIEMTALRGDSYFSLQGSDSRSGTGAGIGAGILRFQGDTAARIIGSGALTSSDDVELLAANQTKVLQIAIGVAAGGGFAGAGSVGYVDFGQRPDNLPTVTGEDRGLLIRDLAENVLNTSAAFIEDRTGLEIAEFNFTRITRTIAQVDVDGEDVDIGGNLLVQAVDARNADVMSGQLALSLNLGFANTLINKFSIQRTDEGKYRIKKRPTAPTTPDSPAPDEETTFDTADESEGVANADAIGEGPGTEGQSNEGGDGDNGGISLGVGVAWARFGGEVDAVIDLADAALFEVAETVTVRARSEADGMTAALGAAVLGDAINASGAITRQAQLVRARITGGGTLNAGAAVVNGLSDNRMRAFAAGLAITDGFAFGATLGLTEMNARTQALVDAQARIDTTGGIALDARDDTRGIGLGIAAGASTGGTSISAANGVVISRSAVDAQVMQGANLTSSGDISVSAKRSQELAGLAYHIAAGNSVGVGGGLGLGTDKGVTTAQIDSSSLTAGGDAAVRAGNNTKVVTSAVGAAVGGSVGVTGSVAMTFKSDTVLAEINDSNVLANDAVLVEALNGGRLDGVGGAEESFFGQFDQISGGITYGGTAGIGISVSVIKSTSQVDALIRGNSTVTANGQGNGIGATSRSETGATFLDRETVARSGVSVIADNSTEVNTLAITGALSQGGGLGFQIPVILLSDTVGARILGSSAAQPSVTSGSDVSVFAGNATRIQTLSAVVGGGLSFGVGALNEVFIIEKNTTAAIERANVSAVRNLSIDAVTPESIRTVLGALGIGVYAGIAGVNQVGITRSRTHAFAKRATLTSGNGMAIRARSPRQMQQNAASLGAAFVGVGASILILSSQDETIAETVDATSIAGRSVLSVGRNLDVLARARMLPFGNPNRIQGPSGNGLIEANQAVIGAGGGVVGIAGAGLYTVSKQVVEARIGAWTTVAAGGTDTVNVRAEQSYAQDVFVMSQSGGFVGGGAAAVISTMRNAVLAEIDDRAIVRASNAVIVEAYGERNFKGASVAGGGGAFSFQGSGVLLSFGKPIRVDEDDDNIDDAQSAIDQADAELQRDSYSGNDDPDTDDADEGFNLRNGDSDLASVLDSVNIARRELSLDDDFNGSAEDTIRTRIGTQTEVTAARVDLESREGGSLELLAGGASGGAISATHGVALVRRGTAIQTIIAEDAQIDATDTDLRVAAIAEVDDGNPEAIAGSGGLIASGAGVSDIRIGRRVTVDIAQGVTLEAANDVSIEAAEISATRAKVSALAVAGIGAGVSVANALRDSTIDVTFAGGADAPSLRATTLNIEARRFGDVEAQVNLLAAGAVGIGVTSGFARDRSDVTIDLGAAELTAFDINVSAKNAGNVLADAFGVVGGLGTTGVNNANAKREASTRILAAGTDISARNLNLLATDNDANVTGGRARVVAETSSTSVAAASLGGSNATAKNASSVVADLIFGLFDILDDARIETRNEADLEYQSKGLTLGLVGIGANRALGEDLSESRLNLRFGQTATVGGRFEAAATGDAYLFGNAVAGNGGIVSASASSLIMRMRAFTELNLGGAKLTAGEIVLRTDRGFDFESNSDSIAVSVADFGVTSQTNSVESTSRLNLTSDIAAKFITIAANTDITKRAIDFNGVTGAYGGITVGALSSKTEVLNDTVIDLGTGSRITQISTATDPRLDTGFVNIAVTADYDLTDRLTAQMGGAVVLPYLISDLLVGDFEDDTAKSRTRINATGTTVTANGDITLAVRSDATLNSEAYIKTFGAAGRGKVKSHTTFRNNADIVLSNSASLTSRRGNINLLVGADQNGVQQIQQHAEGRVYNRTAIPLNSDPDVIGTLSQTNNVTISGSSEVLAALDINVKAEQGFVDNYAYGSAIDAYSEGAEAVVNFFRGLVNADDVSYERESGETISNTYTGLTIDGRLTAGAFNTAGLVVDFAAGRSGPEDINGANDLIFTETGDIDYALQFNVAVGDNLQELIDELIQDRSDEQVAGGTTQQSDAWHTLNDQIEALEARQAFLEGSLGNAQTDFLIFDPLFAAGGSIYLASDYLIGGGTLDARGDAEITVVNNTSLNLRIGAAEIPFTEQGEIRYNDTAVASNTDLIALGAIEIATMTLPDFSAITATASQDIRPRIDIRSTYIADDGPTADVFVEGDIENLNGNVTIATEDGSIYVFGGNIDARSITISSGGDFFLAPSSPLTHLTQSPRALNQSFFDAQESYWNSVYNYMTNTNSSEATARSVLGLAGIQPPSNTDYVSTTNAGSVTALGGIFVYANTLNINGLIQSGITDWDITISAALDAELDTLGPGITPIYLPLAGVPLADAGSDDTNLDLIGNGNTASQIGQNFVTSENVSLFYNGDTDQLELGNIATKGGYIELSGKIISTGNGRLKAASGYGTLNVDNNSRRDLKFGQVDLGPEGGVQGVIKIIDKTKEVQQATFGSGIVIDPFAQPEYVTTTFTQTAGGDVRTVTDLGTGSTVNTATNANYAPSAGLALFYTTGQERDIDRSEIDRTIRTRACTGPFNCSENSSPDTLITGDFEDVIFANRPEVGYIDTVSGNFADYTFLPVRRELNREVTAIDNEAMVLFQQGTFGYAFYNAFGTPWRRIITDMGTRETYTERRVFTHQLRADKPIAIEFAGHEAANAVIDSRGDVLFDRSLRAASGTLDITSQGDIRALNPGVVLQTSDATLLAGGQITGASTSAFAPREFRVTGAVTPRDIFGRTTGADLTPGSALYRNELLAAVQNEAAPSVLRFGGNDVIKIDALANREIRISQQDGSFEVDGQIRSALGSDVQVEAEGSIFIPNAGALIEGGDVSLLAKNGVIGEQRGPGTINNLTVRAGGKIFAQAEDNIRLFTDQGAMRIELVESRSGSVILNNTGTGGVTDAEARETADRRAQAGILSALWTELGLIDTADLRTATKAEVDAAARVIERREKALYDAWWTALTEETEGGKRVQIRDYDPDLVLEYTEQERKELIAKGASEAELDAKVAARTAEFHADAGLYLDSGSYDSSFEYTATLSERAALEAEITAAKVATHPIVAQEIQQREQSYAAWWRVLEQRDPKTGDVTGYADYAENAKFIIYSEERHAQLSANGMNDAEIDQRETRANEQFHAQAALFAGSAFDANYSYAPDATEVKELLADALFTQTELEAAFRRDLILPVLDTQITIEEPNVTGQNVSIFSGQDVGETLAPLVLNAGATLTTAQRLELFTAERSDIRFTDTQVLVGRSDDLDVIARGDLRVDASRHAYVGSEEDINLMFFRGGKDARLKTAGAIARVGNFSDAVTGRNVALEAAGGDIGSSAAPICLNMLPGGGLTARAAGDIYFEAPSSNVPVAEIYALGQTSITATNGTIFDADAGSVVNILTGSVRLFAGGVIGGGPGLLDVELTGPGGTVLGEAQGDFTLNVLGEDVIVERLYSGSVLDARFEESGVTLALPPAGSGATGGSFFEGNLGVTLDINGGIAATTGLVNALQSNGLVDIIARGNLGDATRNLSLNAPRLALRLKEDGSFLNARINAVSDLSLTKLLAGTGEVILTSIGSLRSEIDGFSAGSLTLRTLGDVGAVSDIIIARDLSAGAGSNITLEAARNIEIERDVQLDLQGGGILEAGLRGAGDIISTASGAHILSDAGTDVTLKAAGSLRLGQVTAGGDLRLEAGGNGIIGLGVTAEDLTVNGSSSTQVIGTFRAGTMAFDAGQVGREGAPVSLGPNGTAPLELAISAVEGAQVILDTSGHVLMSTADVSAGALQIDGPTARLQVTGQVRAAGGVDLDVYSLEQRADILSGAGGIRIAAETNYEAADGTLVMSDAGQILLGARTTTMRFRWAVKKYWRSEIGLILPLKRAQYRSWVARSALRRRLCRWMWPGLHSKAMARPCMSFLRRPSR